MNKNYYCVILAGGVGKRIWPVSRQNKPKQFIDLLGTGETLLQSTYKRFLKFISPENIIVTTNLDYADLVREQLPDLPSENLMLEPIRRNTVPPVTWASAEISRRNPDAVMVVTPSDQNITDNADGSFAEEIEQGLDYAQRQQRLLTVGVNPSRAETAYGYIQMSMKMSPNIFKVQTFTEKPQEEFAKIFYESGEFLWNTGIFIWSPKAFLRALNDVSGDYSAMIKDVQVRYSSGQNADEVVSELYSKLPNMTLEQTILERVENADVMLCHFGWADLGTWDSVYINTPKSSTGNALVNNSKAVLYDCNDCLVRLPEGHVAVLQGLSDYIVVEEGNVILVCKKDDQGVIRNFVNSAQLDLGSEFV